MDPSNTLLCQQKLRTPYKNSNIASMHVINLEALHGVTRPVHQQPNQPNLGQLGQWSELELPLHFCNMPGHFGPQSYDLIKSRSGGLQLHGLLHNLAGSMQINLHGEQWFSGAAWLCLQTLSSSLGKKLCLCKALSGQVNFPLQQVQDALGAQQDLVHEAKQRHPDDGCDVYASH